MKDCLIEQYLPIEATNGEAILHVSLNEGRHLLIDTTQKAFSFILYSDDVKY